jgi:hypothetical protein
MHHPLITAQLAHDRQRALHMTAERARAVRANRRCTSSALRAHAAAARRAETDHSPMAPSMMTKWQGI